MGHYFTNENLESKIVKFNVGFNGYMFSFNTDNGVFSKAELDFGTYLLIKNILKKNIKGNILDLGCGYGPIGIIVGKIFNVDTTMVDVNRRAIHLTKMNSKENKFNVNALVSDGFELLDEKYDYIFSNPPIRVGKEKLYELLINSKDHLKEDGEMIIVVREKQGAKSLMRDMEKYYKVELIDKEKGFFIISLK
ncbi:MAG: class I SAM-dependent methyltransferase [archaeon]|nr:class I SAM-dependent methyltransferase [archaeon]